MSETNRHLTTTTNTTTFKQAEPIRPPRGTRPAIHYGSNVYQQQQQQQVSTPEPRRRLSNCQPVNNQHGIQTAANNKVLPVGNNVDDDYYRQQELHQAKLVTVKQQTPSQDDVNRKRTSFNDTPVEFITDEGVGSPTNVEYDDEDEIADEYYDDEEDYVKHYEQTDELANLSRQSMMPLHELIAYYQYIQQGGGDSTNNSQNSRILISRQSSSASKQTTRTKHSSNEDSLDGTMTRCNVLQSSRCDGSEDKNDLKGTNTEAFVGKMIIPKLQVEHVDTVTKDDGKDANKKEKEEGDVEVENDKAITSIPVAPVKDKRRIRANVVLELINSERDFVKHLRDVVEGYLYPARRHPEIFTVERINTIFSNIEQLYEFQRKFLDTLESCINWQDLAESRVGHCFLEYENGFSVYHYYCNNHPNAISELQDLYTKPRFVKFFEACRLLQNMIDISLDGFLLTPIQKICKYPLQLNELLKNTDEDHLDHQPVANALESMRNCANLANERKRRIEALADVMSFQEKVENWFGPKISDTSSILIHSGEVSKMNSHTWSQGVQLYLFNRLLVYCKKDLLKRNSLILKGKINMDSVTEISDVDEYKSKKGFKLFCGEQQKWFVFTTRSEREKDEWIRAFERERNLVEADENEGFLITEREIGVAKRALQNRKHSRSVRYRHKRPDTAIVDQIDLDDATTIMNRTLSLPSCIHPSHVMNFCEESRVVSTSRKKSASPRELENLSSSRSPTSGGSQLCLDQQENQQQQHQSGGSWFRKMGSKKLAKSQVYNVNGIGGLSMRQQRPVSPAYNLVESSTTKYNQLEKRHRDHMVSEELARLIRLNNDLPSQIFPIVSSTTKPQVSALVNRFNSQSQPQLDHQSAGTTVAATAAVSKQNKFHLQDIVAKPVAQDNFTDPRSISSQDSRSISNWENNIMALKEQKADGSSFETTVVLSSGRVVRVREDAV